MSTLTNKIPNGWRLLSDHESIKKGDKYTYACGGFSEFYFGNKVDKTGACRLSITVRQAKHEANPYGDTLCVIRAVKQPANPKAKKAKKSPRRESRVSRIATAYQIASQTNVSAFDFAHEVERIYDNSQRAKRRIRNLAAHNIK